jgi:glycerol-3-phosphate dehydrogenase
LLARYGALAPEVAASGLAELPGAAPYTRAEIVYAATHEGARRLVDVLSRRTRISFELRDGGREAAPVAAELVARPLGWSTARARREVAAYHAWLERERSATGEPSAAERTFVPGRRRLLL